MGMRRRLNDDDPTLINISIKSIRIHEYNKREGSGWWKGKNSDSVPLNPASQQKREGKTRK